MKIRKIIHRGWKELERAKKENPKNKVLASMPQLFGKYQYIYSSKKGEVSLIELLNYSL